MDSEPRTRIAAEDYLEALAAHGIDHLFCNPGTDFAPIVEAFARSRKQGAAVPEPMVIPYENTAVSMAHGVYMVTGQPQAVMVHTTDVPLAPLPLGDASAQMAPPVLNKLPPLPALTMAS